MHFIRHRKFVHWIAALAILLSALAPAVSQALSLASNGQGFVIEICSSNGIKMTQVIGGEDSSSSLAMGSHCPYCVVQPTYLLPSIGAFEFAAPQRYVTQSLSTYQAPQILSAWVRIPSRAPPTES
ncbi:DUF2946 family protein [Polynucleobacter necessarius]|uniref:DUF2946 family protein n=1 Tax=Polynucleobacter necessarius TaxID=576610 RepID=UPI000FE24674|nr:DUF2946 family protein [Polynucleobacter necessarius]